jgi:hypothetical protein
MDGLDAALWRKSSYSGSNGGAYVEVAELSGIVAVREDPHGPELAFARREWEAFTASVKAGEPDLT